MLAVMPGCIFRSLLLTDKKFSVRTKVLTVTKWLLLSDRQEFAPDGYVFCRDMSHDNCLLFNVKPTPSAFSIHPSQEGIYLVRQSHNLRGFF